MEASGGTAKEVPCIHGGRKTKVWLLAHYGKVNIGNLLFERDDLLIAMGVNSADIRRLERGSTSTN